MDKKILLLTGLFLVIFIPTAYAIDESTSSSARPQVTKDRLMELKKDFQATKQDSKEKRKEMMDKMRLEFKEKRVEFKKKLLELRDLRKKTVVENVDLKLATINKNATDRMTSSIVKLEQILEKLTQKAQTAQDEGMDTSEVDAAVVEAKNAIQTAKDAVATQAAKEYIASITDESTLKQTVGLAMSNLRKDLNTTHDSVKTAKQKVIDVARALAKLKGVTPTVSPSI